MSKYTPAYVKSAALQLLAWELQSACEALCSETQWRQASQVSSILSKMNTMLRWTGEAKAATFTCEIHSCLERLSQADETEGRLHALGRAIVLLLSYCLGSSERIVLSIDELNLLRTTFGKKPIGSASVEGERALLSSEVQRGKDALHARVKAQLDDLEASLIQQQSLNKIAQNPFDKKFSQNIKTLIALYELLGAQPHTSRFRENHADETLAIISLRAQIDSWQLSMPITGKERVTTQFNDAQMLLAKAAIDLAVKETLKGRREEIVSLCASEHSIKRYEQFMQVARDVLHDCFVFRRVFGLASRESTRRDLLGKWLALLQRSSWYLSALKGIVSLHKNAVKIFLQSIVNFIEYLEDFPEFYSDKEAHAAHWNRRLREHALRLDRLSHKALRGELCFRMNEKELGMFNAEWAAVVQRIESIINQPHCTTKAGGNDEIFLQWNALIKLCAIAKQKALLHVVSAFGELLTLSQERRQLVVSNWLALLKKFLAMLRMLAPFPSNGSQEHLKVLEDVFLSIQEAIWQSGLVGAFDSPAAIEDTFLQKPFQANAGVSFERWPRHLAQNLRRLLAWTTTIKDVSYPSEKFEAINGSLLLELRVLWVGSSALSVYRITQASESLVRLHQQLSKGVEQEQFQCLWGILLPAHAALRRSLNEAAARRFVSFPKDLLEKMSRAVDSLSIPSNNDGQDLRAVFFEEARQRTLTIKQSTESMIAVKTETKGTVNDSTSTTNFQEIILRELHTLKGSARVFGERELSQICHQCEHLVLHKGEGNAIELNIRRLQDIVTELSGRARGWDSKKEGMVSEPSGCFEATLSFRVLELVNKIAADQDAMLRVIASDTPYQIDTKLELLESLLTEHSASIDHLQESLSLKTKKPFASIVPRLVAVAESYSAGLRKSVKFVVENAQIQASASVVDLLVAPLEHLLRNAIAHGIESEEDRLAGGKPVRGNITLSFALLERNQLSIDLYDDGAGVSLSQISAMGVSEEHATSLEYLCQTGFSTKEQADEDSGHGLGLASVKQALAYLRGQLSMTSEVGKGARFKVVLPLI